MLHAHACAHPLTIVQVLALMGKFDPPRSDDTYQGRVISLATCMAPRVASAIVATRAGVKRPEEYLAKERAWKRTVHVDLDDPRFDPVFEYALATGPDRPVQDGIRDLLLQATAADAANPAIRAARQQALMEARNYVARAIWVFLNQLTKDLQLRPIAGEPAGAEPTNTISADALPRKAVA